MLAWQLNFRMADPVVSSKSVRPAEGLLLGTHIATNFHLACVVNGVFVASEIVWAGEDGVAGFSCAGVDTVAPVRSSLAAHCAWRGLRILRLDGASTLRLAVALTFVLL